MVTVVPPMLIATRNAGKLRELVPWFASVGVTIETLDAAGLDAAAAEDALESHETFEDNALAKARYFHERSGGRVVVAEDSGLEVEALRGAPGVRSKRWSGRADLEGVALDAANNALLLQSLAAASLEGRASRAARYVCAAACVWPSGAVVVRGETAGVIVEEAQGTGGFGYDPYVWSPELGATFASVSREAKSRVSHRGRAFAQLLRRLVEVGVVAGGGGVDAVVDQRDSSG
jgi:XTP/dITP diphosphohydrolase